MPYYVIKWRKGNPYLYQQTTYRDGGKIRTKNVYIGRAGGNYRQYSDDEIVVTKETTEKDVRIHTAKKIYIRLSKDEINSEVLKNRKKIKTALSKQKNNTENSKEKFECHVDLSKHKISEATLKREQERIVYSLNKLGVDTSKFKIKIVSGGKIPESQKIQSTGERHYKVNMPRFSKGNRTKFKTEYKISLARSALELTKEQKSDIYSNIQYFFDESYRNTQNLLNQYILNTNDKNRTYKALLVKGIFGMFGGYIPDRILKKKVNPKEIGLVDKTRRKSWDDDAIIVLADMIGKGYNDFISERKAEYKKAEYELINAKEELKKIGLFEIINKFIAKKRFQRAISRFELQKEMMRKIGYLSSIFKHL